MPEEIDYIEMFLAKFLYHKIPNIISITFKLTYFFPIC